jgi:hypothetical protein
MSSTDLYQEEVPQVDTASAASTLLQKAQERRQKRESTLFLDVPTWDGDLIAEYRILGPDEMKAFSTKALARARNGAEPGANDMALIAAMCVGLYVMDPDTSKREPITDEFGHVGYNRIASFLGKEHVIDSQAEAIKYLMSERDKNDPDKYVVNLIAINLHAASIQRWMRDTSKRSVDLEALLGEL